MKNNKYVAILTYKTQDNVESKIMNEKYAKVVLDVYMTPIEFAEFLTEYTGKSFKVEFSK